jgi:hypothetical protein
MADAACAKEPTHTENWQTLPWKQFQRNVFRLQQRIYRAARRGDWHGDRRNNRYTNLALLHAHCHDQLHGKRCQ